MPNIKANFGSQNLGTRPMDIRNLQILFTNSMVISGMGILSYMIVQKCTLVRKKHSVDCTHLLLPKEILLLIVDTHIDLFGKPIGFGSKVPSNYYSVVIAIPNDSRKKYNFVFFAIISLQKIFILSVSSKLPAAGVPGPAPVILQCGGSGGQPPLF